MQTVFLDSLPAVLKITPSTLALSFLPYEDAAVVRARGKYSAILWVCPCDSPYCTFVSLQSLCQSVLLAFYLEDLDGLVGRAGRESSPVVVENRIVLLKYLSANSDGAWVVPRMHTIISS